MDGNSHLDRAVLVSYELDNWIHTMNKTTPEQQSNDTVEMFTAMAKEGGGPVYAQQIQYGTGEKGEPFVWFSMGLTKREEFAARAMEGMLAGATEGPQFIAEKAVEYADALLERLKK